MRGRKRLRSSSPSGFSRRRSVLLFVAGLLTTIAIVLLAQTALSLLSGVRAYVGGEGLWSKAQKEAVHWLHEYVSSRDPAAYASYQKAIAVPLGDRMAREELEKASPDPAVVVRGFVLGRNHPDDVPAMSWLVRDFGRMGYMQKALGIWKRGDAEIAVLVSTADRLNAAVLAGQPAEDLARILNEIDAINARVTPLEDDFSFTLGEAARWAKSVAFLFIVVASTLLFALGTLVVRKLVRDIAASEANYRTVTETATDGILSMDERGRILFANLAALQIFGYSLDALEGQEFSMLIPERLRGDPDASIQRFLEAAQGEAGGRSLRLAARHCDGREIPVEVSFGASEGARRVFTGIVRDITHRLQTEQQIERLAYHDVLTGLPNRALFQDRLTQALANARRQGEQLALLFLDLDEFKLINDSLGHSRGDRVLEEVGRRLKTCLRSRDTAARLGGDEFIVFLPQAADPESVAFVAQKVLDRIAAPIEMDGNPLFITASMGISVFPSDGPDSESLMRSADIAMYRAKEHGASGYEFFTPEMNQQILDRYEVERSLYRAFEAGQFVLHYQPIWKMDAQQMVGVEALVRWNHPERGLLMPADFIAVAEDSQVMVPLGEWILAEACAQLRRWRDGGVSVGAMSVNLSARQFQQRNLPDTVDRALASAGLSAESLHLEITESAAMKNLDLSIRTLEALRERGIRVLMDDFGSGHASIGYLRRFPLDALKIDRSFVSRIETSPPDAAMARAIIEMAHGLGMTVVAEGVESPGQLAFLRAHGCDEFQGFLGRAPSAPAPLEEFLAGREARQ